MAVDLASVDLDAVKESFTRDGYALVRGALSAEEMAPIQAQWERVREPLAAGQTIDGIRRDNFYIHGELPAPVGEVYRHPVVTKVAKTLIGPDVAIYLNRLNVKDRSFSDPIHLHQDEPYFNGKPGKVNFFVALQDINLGNGAMVYVPGSQKLGPLGRETIDVGTHPELDVIVPSLRPGDLVIADIRLWHSSVPNSLGTDRVLLQMIFQPATDGSYYPPSIDSPRLVAGSWQTETFEAWKPLEAPKSAAAPAVTQSSPLLQRAAAALPPRVKEPLKRFVAKKNNRG
jgi:ectoine hydroxylase-related dioxygenase (phytanoyl-CoA dioxygenase family)